MSTKKCILKDKQYEDRIYNHSALHCHAGGMGAVPSAFGHGIRYSLPAKAWATKARWQSSARTSRSPLNLNPFHPIPSKSASACYPIIQWKENVLRNQTIRNVPLSVGKKKKHRLVLKSLDEGCGTGPSAGLPG